MRALADTCVAGQAVAFLRGAGWDVVWSLEWERDPGDEALLEAAYGEKRVLLTIDKDFGELAVLREAPHSGIVRLVELSAVEQGPLAKVACERYFAELGAGAIVTVEPGRVRIRPALNDGA